MKIIIFLLFCLSIFSQPTISTAQYDTTRNGVNKREYSLTPSTVVNMVNLGTYTLDGAILATPLYIPEVTISSIKYNVLIVVTLNNTIYALNADAPGSSPLWSTNFGSTWNSPFGNYYSVNLGIVSTPVVDVAGGYIYLVSVNGSVTYTLRKIALTTGVQSTSIDIVGVYPGAGGSGDHTSGSNVVFYGPWEVQHTPLTLANGNVYFGFSAGNEPFAWHGWIFSYDIATLTQQAVLLTTASAYGGGTSWVAAGFPVDSSGNLYIITGNGVYDGISNFSQSILKVSPTLQILDWFTPSNWSSLTSVDADLASGLLMLIPGTSYLTFGSKDGRAWVINSNDMGHLQGSGTAPQVFTIQAITAGGGTGVYSGLFFNGNVYFNIAGNPIYGFSFSGSTFNTTPFATSSTTYNQMTASGSSNYGSNSILWGLTVAANPAGSAKPVTLRALNPTTLAEYWNSGNLGECSKFAAPLVVNGKVYVPTYDSGLIAFGLLPAARNRGTSATRGTGVIR